MNISIITAAFRPKYMDRVWESIKKQKHTDWEWIIVNDGQQGIRDWYKSKTAELGKKVWFIDLERQRGYFGLYSRNIGAMAAHYNHIIFLDDDNEWTEDHLSSLVDLEEKTGKTPYCWMHYKGKKPGSTFEKLKRTGFSKQGIDLGCPLFKKKQFEDYGYFRTDAQVTFDWNAMERIYIGEGGADHFACTDKPSLIFYHKRY